MLDRLRELKQQGRWAEIRAIAPDILTHLAGDDKAKALLWLSQAYEETASTAAEYRTALSHAKASFSAAVPGGLMHTWAAGRVAALASDLGDFSTAISAGITFLDQLPQHPDAGVLKPWAYFALGQSLYYRRRDYVGSIRWFRLAVSSGTGEIRERSTLWLGWALAASGQVGEATSALPETIKHVSVGQLSAARAAVAYAAGDWQGARSHATIALLEYKSGAWPIYDSIQVAELYLILAKAAQRLGLQTQAARWFIESATILARWNAAFRLVPTLRERGGDWINAADCSCGPAGDKRCGLLGVVG